MPDKVYLEITNACNLACPFCPPTRRGKAFLSREAFELVLARLEGSGPRGGNPLLYFHVKGEPLLHPALGEFLALSAARGFEQSLTTNGTLLAERGPELLEPGRIRKLSVSLHSHSGSAGAEAYWRGVEAFLDLHAARPGFPVSLRLWSRVEGELPPETEPLWALIRARYPAAGDWAGSARSRDSLELAPRVYLNQAERYAWPDPSLPEEGERGFCRGLRNQVGILVDGRVVPCCMDGEGLMTLGSIFESPLAEILGSPRARAIYEGFTARRLVEPLCRTCGYRRRFSKPT
jgi:hypothetical protein